MRFLCLHGYATSAEIMQEQMQPIMAQLPSDWEYEFLNAEMEPNELVLPSIDQVPKPNYSWYNLPYSEDIERAYHLVTDFIESEGPFDGVWGFSQGGSMAALTLLRSHAQSGDSNYPFKMAIFTSAFLPHSLDTGSISWNLSSEGKLSPTRVLGESCIDESKEADWRTDPRTEVEYNILATNQHKMAFPVELRLRYMPGPQLEKLTIPSVHIRGLADHYHFVNDSVLALFDPDSAKHMTHRGGHHFPRFSEELVEFAEMIIETAVFVN